jgi:hypothetical protein
LALKGIRPVPIYSIYFCITNLYAVTNKLASL